jgi:hypothetical protein
MLLSAEEERWLSGGAPDCKSVVLGSNPAPPQHMANSVSPEVGSHLGKHSAMCWPLRWQRYAGRSGQFRGQKGLGPLEKHREMPRYTFCPRKKNISRTFKISGALIVKLRGRTRVEFGGRDLSSRLTTVTHP